MPGVPGIYVHSLFGSRNDLEAVNRTGRNRSINRSQLDVESLLQQLENAESLRSMVFAAMSKLLTARKENSAFQPYGEFSFPEFDGRVFSVLRVDPECGRRVLCLTNVCAKTVPVPASVLAGPARDLLTGADVPAGKFELAGFATSWLELPGS